MSWKTESWYSKCWQKVLWLLASIPVSLRHAFLYQTRRRKYLHIYLFNIFTNIHICCSRTSSGHTWQCWWRCWRCWRLRDGTIIKLMKTTKMTMAMAMAMAKCLCQINCRHVRYQLETVRNHDYNRVHEQCCNATSTFIYTTTTIKKMLLLTLYAFTRSRRS